MKICMYSVDRIFEPSTGGIRRFGELLNALLSRGHDITLYSLDADALRESEGIKGQCIEIYAGLIGKLRLCKDIKKGHFDRVIVFDVKAATPLIIGGVDNIYLFLRQDLYLYRNITMDGNGRNAIKKALYLKMVRVGEFLCLKRAEKIIVQCQFDLNGILDRHPLIADMIRKKTEKQINNINPSWVVSQTVNETDNEQRYDLVFVGNFKDKRKGHDLLIPAIQSLTDSGFLIQVAIIGDGTQMERYQKSCIQYPNIEFLGRMKDPSQIIRKSRLMIVPSYADSCPNTIMEALYYHVPVIGANTSGIPEILNNDEWVFNLTIDSIETAIRFALEPQKNREIKIMQTVRSKELTFDWGEKMSRLVEK